MPLFRKPYSIPLIQLCVNRGYNRIPLSGCIYCWLRQFSLSMWCTHLCKLKRALVHETLHSKNQIKHTDKWLREARRFQSRCHRDCQNDRFFLRILLYMLLINTKTRKNRDGCQNRMKHRVWHNGFIPKVIQIENTNHRIRIPDTKKGIIWKSKNKKTPLFFYKQTEAHQKDILL